MSLFNGFEDILKCVIENTAYLESDISDEERYHKAMKAIFGESQQDEYLSPPKPKKIEEGKIYCDVNYADLMWIHTMRCNGIGLETAIKQKISALLPKPRKPKDLKDFKKKQKIEDAYWTAISDRDEEYKRAFDRIKRQFDEKKNHYALVKPLWTKEDHKSDNEISKLLAEYEQENKEKKENVFQALRQADWPI